MMYKFTIFCICTRINLNLKVTIELRSVVGLTISNELQYILLSEVQRLQGRNQD